MAWVGRPGQAHRAGSGVWVEPDLGAGGYAAAARPVRSCEPGKIARMTTPAAPAVHDLRQPTWGRAATFGVRRPDGSWTASVFLPAPLSEGDIVLVRGRTGDLRYRVRGPVDTPADPGDLNLVNLVHVPDAVPAA